MQNTLKAVIILSITSFILFSCENSEESEMKNQQMENENTYQPGENWTLVWADEFDGESIDSNTWNYQIEEAGRFNEEWQRYTNSSENAYVENSCLVIKAIHESEKHGINQYTSARMNTANKYAFKYGKIAARIKLPEGQGIWPAFWMLGANIDENGGDTPWPQTGEIDIFELYGSKNDSIVEANAHYADSSESHAMMGAISYQLKEGKFSDDFHVFELEWNEEKMTWLVDGEAYGSMEITEAIFSEFQKEFFILLNIAVGGTHAGYPDETTTFPQYMYTDWIRVYEKIE
ncbi:MAG: family 16 glycosylhydrolase [Saprospiraceae bacterium]